MKKQYNNSRCPICNKSKKSWFKLCFECNQKGLEIPSQKEIDIKQIKENSNKKFNRLEKNNDLPNWSDFMKDFYKIEDDVVRYIFKSFNFVFEKKGLFRTKITEYEVKFEENFWDIVIIIHKTPEMNLIFDKNLKWVSSLCLEYKSSLYEWGKQIDAFFRQIKKREVLNKNMPPILISFDERFKEYDSACKKANIKLIVLPKEMLNKMKGKEDRNYYQ